MQDKDFDNAEQIRSILTARLNIDKSTPYEKISSEKVPSWDSFATVEIVLEIEKQFSISLSLNELTAFDSHENILRVIGPKLASSHG